MIFPKEIDAGTLTIERLSTLINFNAAEAEKLAVKLSWCYEGVKICGRVKIDKATMWKKYYEGEHTHIIIARLHWDFSIYLKALSDSRAAEQRRLAHQRQVQEKEDSKLTMGQQAGLK